MNVFALFACLSLHNSACQRRTIQRSPVCACQVDNFCCDFSCFLLLIDIFPVIGMVLLVFLPISNCTCAWLRTYYGNQNSPLLLFCNLALFSSCNRLLFFFFIITEDMTRKKSNKDRNLKTPRNLLM